MPCMTAKSPNQSCWLVILVYNFSDKACVGVSFFFFFKRSALMSQGVFMLLSVVTIDCGHEMSLLS